MRTFQEWQDSVNECINSAMKALEGADIPFDRKGNELVISKEDQEKAEKAIEKDASSPSDKSFLTTK